MEGKRVLVTGASGFIGEALCRELSNNSYRVVKGLRRREIGCDTNALFYSEIGPDTDWTGKLSNIEAIVHLAARVHVLKEDSSDPLKAYRSVNVIGSARLAQEARRQGVKRFVFLSSIGINGIRTGKNAFKETDPPNPYNYYSQSKLEAEYALNEISNETGLEIVIIRSPLVYGPGVRANFLTLLNFVKKGIPLPFASIDNLRSYINISNLVSFIRRVIDSPEAVGELFLVSDDEDISTPDLIERIGKYMDREVKLIAVPPILLNGVASIFNMRPQIDRLCSSLQINIGKAKEVLEWKPEISVERGIEKTVREYLDKI